MVNNTVKKKIGKAAGKDDKTIITSMQTVQTSKDLEAPAKVERNGLFEGEFVSIKAYPGGNPNKEKEGLSHE